MTHLPKKYLDALLNLRLALEVLKISPETLEDKPEFFLELFSSYEDVTNYLFEYHCKFLYNDLQFETDVFKPWAEKYIPRKNSDFVFLKKANRVQFEVDFKILVEFWDIYASSNNNDFLIKDIRHFHNQLKDTESLLSNVNSNDEKEFQKVSLDLLFHYNYNTSLFLECLYARNLLVYNYKQLKDFSFFKCSLLELIFTVDRELFSFLFDLLLYLITYINTFDVLIKNEE